MEQPLRGSKEEAGVTDTQQLLRDTSGDTHKDTVRERANIPLSNLRGIVCSVACDVHIYIYIYVVPELRLARGTLGVTRHSVLVVGIALGAVVVSRGRLASLGVERGCVRGA